MARMVAAAVVLTLAMAALAEDGSMGTMSVRQSQPEAASLWSSTVTASPSPPETIVVEGVKEDGIFRPRSAYLPQAATNEDYAQPVAAFAEDLLPGSSPRLFGSEERVVLSDLQEVRCTAGARPAGAVFPLPAAMPVGADVSLVVEGEAPRSFGIVLVRRGGDAGRWSDVLARAAGLPASLDFTADSGAAELDLVLLCPPTASVATVQAAHIEPRPSEATHPTGSWLWDVRPWLGKEHELVAATRRLGLDNLYLQLPFDDSALLEGGDVAALLTTLGKAGVVVHAVEGDPDMVTETGRANALRRAGAAVTFMARHPGLIEGLQYDIETYLRSDHARGGWQAWARTVEALSQETGLSLGVVVPFWMIEGEAGRHALESVKEAVAEVVIMAYRTDPAAVERMAAPWLAWGVERKVPVRVALENGPIPVEYHRTYRRADEGTLALRTDDVKARVALLPDPVQADAAALTYAFSHEVAVEAGRITFRGDPAALNFARERLAYLLSAWPSFAGLVIHEVIPSGGEPTRAGAAKGDDG